MSGIDKGDGMIVCQQTAAQNSKKSEGTR